CWQDVQLPPTF
nr:immunoglobulin light chain junction region [Macaca mulatta]MOX97279.1 immunoglobulin light chain junction region [Macaca mulatta]MOX97411.1 immunoglobulin light chain junction region [Macaca mulatta]MOX98386.1 immunoglobulin light chain junction region [Macaca mulatta]MOY02315.1 immunoglobulin light chain junction region [Macaca mulatta]